VATVQPTPWHFSYNASSGPVIGKINKEKKDDKAFNVTQEHLNASVPR
jgi:hypothetical protein